MFNMSPLKHKRISNFYLLFIYFTTFKYTTCIQRTLTSLEVILTKRNPRLRITRKYAHRSRVYGRKQVLPETEVFTFHETLNQVSKNGRLRHRHPTLTRFRRISFHALLFQTNEVISFSRRNIIPSFSFSYSSSIHNVVLSLSLSIPPSHILLFCQQRQSTKQSRKYRTITFSFPVYNTL